VHVYTPPPIFVDTPHFQIPRNNTEVYHDAVNLAGIIPLVRVKFNLTTHIPVYLFICLPVYLFICLSVYLFICLSVYAISLKIQKKNW